MNSIIENILTRRSIRTFRETQLSEEDLNTILTAGSYAPNGMGTQSWKFTAIQKTSVLAKVNEAIRLTLILSIIVGTYITKILVPMLLYPKLHNIAYV